MGFRSDIIDLAFTGGHAVTGSCFVQVEADEKVMTVFCVQKPHYFGISVTNALEYIIAAFVSRGRSGALGADIAGWLMAHSSAARETSKSRRGKTGRFGSLFASRKRTPSGSYRDLDAALALIRNGLLHWVEVYPPLTGPWGERTIARRVLFGADNSPLWLGLEEDDALARNANGVVKQLPKAASQDPTE